MIPSRARKPTTHAALAGLLGGLAGTLAMNYAQRLWTKAVDGEPPQSAGGKHDSRDWQEREEGRNANEVAAQAIAQTVLGRALTREESTVAARIVHFSFGAAVGAIYGGVIRDDDRSAFSRGPAFGAVVWLAADEVAMPLLRLSRPTTERSLEAHVQSFMAHMVFGTVAELVRARAMRAHARSATQRPYDGPLEGRCAARV